MKKKINQRIKESFRVLYWKLAKINDTPQRIALGLGVGVFAGIMPATGPLAALFLAFIFRVNRLAALLGSLATNTWLSFVTFLLAIRLGSAIFKISWQEVYRECLAILRNFQILSLFSHSILKIILPLIVGYLLIGFIAGLIVYLVALIIIKIKLRRKDGN